MWHVCVIHTFLLSDHFSVLAADVIHRHGFVVQLRVLLGLLLVPVVVLNAMIWEEEEEEKEEPQRGEIAMLSNAN